MVRGQKVKEQGLQGHVTYQTKVCYILAAVDDVSIKFGEHYHHKGMCGIFSRSVDQMCWHIESMMMACYIISRG